MKTLDHSESTNNIKQSSNKKRIKVFSKQHQATELEMQNLNQYTSVKPGEPTLIKILNPTKNMHENHPINKYLRSVNMFSQLTMIRAANFKAGGTLLPLRAS